MTTTIPVPHVQYVAVEGERALMQDAFGELEYAEQTDADCGAMRVLLDDLEVGDGKLTLKGLAAGGNRLAEAHGLQRVELLTKVVELYAQLQHLVNQGMHSACAEKIAKDLATYTGLLESRKNPPVVRLEVSAEATAAGLLDELVSSWLGPLKLEVVRLLAGPREDQAQIGRVYEETLAALEKDLANPEQCLSDLCATQKTGGEAYGRRLIACGGTCTAKRVGVRRMPERALGVPPRRLAVQLFKAAEVTELKRLLEPTAEGEFPESVFWLTYAAVLAELGQQSASAEFVSVLWGICRRCRPSNYKSLPAAVCSALQRVRKGAESATSV
jgi:hypothetical protein